MVQAVPDVWTGKVLDVGCRTGEFSKVLSTQRPGKIVYVGIDLQAPASALANLEKGLPFPNRTFEVAVALDVLEHTDNIHMAFAELCRVTRSYVLILLPNAFEITSRLKFVQGKRLSSKYGLPLSPPMDRHRWLFSFDDARAFTHHLTSKTGFAVHDERCVVGPRRAGLIAARACESWPNLFCQWYFALLKRVDKA